MKSTRGFTLIELMVVVAIMALMMALSGPLISSLSGANSVDKAVTDLSNTLEQARAYAMANSTYVRVGFGTVAKSSSSPIPLFVVFCLYSSDGTLSVTDMTQWPTVGRPLVLSNFNFNNNLVTNSADVTPGTPSAPSALSFTRAIASLGSITFNGCIQFSPNGTAQVVASTPARFIAVAIDRPAPLEGKNPFVLRLGGLTGTIEVLRKENL